MDSLQFGRPHARGLLRRHARGFAGKVSENLEAAAVPQERFELTHVLDRERVVRLEVRSAAGAVAAVAGHWAGTGVGRFSPFARRAADRAGLVGERFEVGRVALCVLRCLACGQCGGQAVGQLACGVVAESPAVVGMAEVVQGDDVGSDALAIVPQRMPPPYVVAEIPAPFRDRRPAVNVHTHDRCSWNTEQTVWIGRRPLPGWAGMRKTDAPE